MVVGIISKEDGDFTGSEFVWCCLLGVAEEVYSDKTKIIQDLSLEHVRDLYMNLE